MNDRTENAAGGRATTDLPLQAQLMGSLALVFILSAVAGLIGYATFDGSTLEKSVAAKANVYVSTLSSQTVNAVIAENPLTAEAVIAPLQSDKNVYGVAVYAPGGKLLAGHGHFPAKVTAATDAVFDDDRVLVSVRELPV